MFSLLLATTIPALLSSSGLIYCKVKPGLRKMGKRGKTRLDKVNMQCDSEKCSGKSAQSVSI